MKKLLLLLLAVLPLVAYGQYKVKEKSRKEKPVWVNGAEKGFLIVSATAPTVEEAKEKVVLRIREQVVKAIATRIESETCMESRQENENEHYTYTESMTSQILSKAARIPFVSQVSLSKAQDYYWEKLYDKARKAYLYEYHVRYKFSILELERMVKEFNQRESKLDTQLEEYSDRLSRMTSVEEIGRVENELKGLAAEFASDDPRHRRTLGLMGNYQALYDQIILGECGRGNGYVTVELLLGDRRIGCSEKPDVTSGCASEFDILPQSDGTFRIGYDDFNCYPDDDNFVEVRFIIHSRSLVKRCHITLNHD